MATYSEIKNGLDAIAEETTRARSLLSKARTSMAAAETMLNSMPTKWGPLGSDIDSEAVANPSDEVYQIAKNEKDKLVADFQSLKAYATNLITAFDGVSE